MCARRFYKFDGMALCLREKIIGFTIPTLSFLISLFLWYPLLSSFDCVLEKLEGGGGDCNGQQETFYRGSLCHNHGSIRKKSFFFAPSRCNSGHCSHFLQTFSTVFLITSTHLISTLCSQTIVHEDFSFKNVDVLWVKIKLFELIYSKLSFSCQ
ncbi:hypothetical protein PAHAL_2G259100 [Panicum hallii]|uniref:Uncharacterized protein n=1 Tax=Panicum hallii TaxID=206008 RepID=A0A2S3GZF4_9POAL|nr:hypothetical protein PAHAL_2G259100 [Panicum hallii]